MGARDADHDTAGSSSRLDSDTHLPPLKMADEVQAPQPREPSRHLDQPSFFDNFFAPSEGEDLRRHGQGLSGQDRRPVPKLVLHAAAGSEMDLGDKDFEIVQDTDSESDVRAVKSIEMIDDLGMRDLREPVATQTPFAASTDSLIGQATGMEYPIAFTGASFVESDNPTGRELDVSQDTDNQYDIDNVVDEIYSTLEKSDASDADFWPLSQIWRVINPNCVRHILKNDKTLKSRFLAMTAGQSGNERLEECVRAICGPDPSLPSTGRRKILAILILINKVENIVDFIDACIYDIHLPLRATYDRKSKTCYLERRTERASQRSAHGKDEQASRQGIKPQPIDALFLRNGWSRLDVDLFGRNQSRMLAPYLRRSSNKLLIYKIPDEAVLPFVEYKRKIEGGYGTIYRVKIHPAHHELEMPDAHIGHDMPYYAVKKLHFADEKDATREIMVFEKFSGDRKGDAHLIRLLLAYKYKEEYYFVFHWADCNLHQLWRDHPEVDTSHDNCRWMINQCVGIAKGLSKIHRGADSFHGGEQANRLAVPSFHNQSDEKNWGRHGDIKPENILWFKRQNRLVISDFGLSRLPGEQAEYGDPYDSLLGISPTYRAPECDLRLNINHKYDIWALGCVFLEFLSWFVLDDTIEDFVIARITDDRGDLIQEDKFFIVVDNKAEVKKSVKEWMEKIRSSKKCTRFIHDFVGIIERDLLVPDVENRKYCEEVVNELIVLQSRCRRDAEYCVQPISHVESLDSEGEQPVVRSSSIWPPLEATTSHPEMPPRIMLTPDTREPGTKAEMEFANVSEDGKATTHGRRQSQDSFEPDNKAPSLEDAAVYGWLDNLGELKLFGREAGDDEPVDMRGPDDDDSLPHISLAPAAEVDPSLPGHSLQSDSGYGTASLTTTEQKVLLPGPEDDIQSAAADDDDDAKTNYSDTLSVRLSTQRFGSSIGEMVNELLVQKFVDQNIDHQILGECAAVLPGLLKALALKIGFEAPSQIHRDVMVFLHKNREDITEAFKNACAKEIEDILGDEADSEPRDKEPPSQEMLDRWLNEPDNPTTDYEAEPKNPFYDSEKSEPLHHTNERSAEDNKALQLHEYRKLMLREPTYEWLVSRLRREAYLSRASPDVMGEIGESVRAAEAFRVSKLSRGQSPKGVRAIFSVDWDPVAFLTEQNYSKPNAEVIAEVVTLTGMITDAQAISCWEYVTQTWPVNGQQTVGLIQDVLRSKGRQCQRKTQEGSVISASLEASKVVVEVVGIPDFAAEVAEQLAWMGAAMSQSQSWEGLVICKPFMKRTDYDPSPYKGKTTGSSTDLPTARWNIEFEFTPCSLSPGLSGQCWHAMFRKPVVVHGFPIPRRPEPKTGLEIPLSMMAALSGTRLVDTFASKSFIKGFSSMLVPTKRSDDIVFWHFLQKSTPTGRMSYLDCSLEHAAVAIPELEASRHLVGWCQDCSFIAGTRSANYTIMKSGLPETSVGCVLHKVEVSGGQFITGTLAFSLGNREKTTHISRSHYTDKMEWISSQNVILWDELTKQGWLLDGGTALLHLLRSSLEHSKQKFKSAFLMNLDNLKDVLNPNGASAAIEFLLHVDNRELPLYRDKTEIWEEVTWEGSTSTSVPKKKVKYYLLEDRIEHLYNILEKLIDHQADVERRSGIPLRMRPRRQLEGWDFKDIASSGDPLCSRVATLGAMGKGWVDFSRQICAVTLFGKGFGDLIQPRNVSPKVCSRWSQLPTQRHYLAARVSDLRRIMDDNGDETSNPPRLCQSIEWHINEGAFQSCPCTAGSNAAHHDPVQVLFPLKFIKKLRQGSWTTLRSMLVASRGAVIFGHNFELSWLWEDEGNPTKGALPPEPETSAAGITKPMSRDSGLGTSLQTSASQGDTQLESTPSMASGPPSVPSILRPSRPVIASPESGEVAGGSNSAAGNGKGSTSRLRKWKSYVKEKARLR